jgi:hypothetical protein
MKKKIAILVLSALMLGTFISTLKSQDSLSVVTGADIYSNYIWRGSKFGTGPAFQPTVKFIYGGLTVGVWGSFDASGYTETDPYISYTLPFGLSLGLTDYYYPTSGGSLFSDTTNAVELNAGYTIGGLSLSANYIVNEAPIPASVGADTYFQAAYAFSSFNISVGGGNGWHTSDTKFNICHVGVGTTKTIKITDSFSLPVTGQFILNPEKKNMFVVVGISF